MWAGVSVLERATAELVPIDTLKKWFAIEHDDDDAILAQMLRGAIARIDGPDGIGYAMMRQTWRKSLDCFSSCIHLPGAPVKGIRAVSYVDDAGELKTVNEDVYRLDADREPARLTPAPGKSWPAAARVPGAVKVDYYLGEENAAEVRADLIDAVTLIVGHRYQHREAASAGKVETLPLGVEWILNENARCAVSA
ncbi:head-tail connector protein [Rhizobium panacihumi]|uniref:head-tail connector protein n=1 Tax=Rhizobium panacihumi TaxID=2008450 RepID=UPI003D7A375C